MPQARNPIRHLWIVATEPEAQSGNVIMVNITTLQDHSDTTLILDRGDHPYLTKKSVVFYDDARIIDIAKVARGIEAGFWPQQPRCSATLIRRIQAGLLKSTRTKPSVKEFFRTLANAMGSHSVE